MQGSPADYNQMHDAARMVRAHGRMLVRMLKANCKVYSRLATPIWPLFTLQHHLVLPEQLSLNTRRASLELDLRHTNDIMWMRRR